MSSHTRFYEECIIANLYVGLSLHWQWCWSHIPRAIRYWRCTVHALLRLWPAMYASSSICRWCICARRWTGRITRSANSCAIWISRLGWWVWAISISRCHCRRRTRCNWARRDTYCTNACTLHIGHIGGWVYINGHERKHKNITYTYHIHNVYKSIREIRCCCVPPCQLNDSKGKYNHKFFSYNDYNNMHTFSKPTTDLVAGSIQGWLMGIAEWIWNST